MAQEEGSDDETRLEVIIPASGEKNEKGRV